MPFLIKLLGNGQDFCFIIFFMATTHSSKIPQDTKVLCKKIFEIQIFIFGIQENYFRLSFVTSSSVFFSSFQLVGNYSFQPNSLYSKNREQKREILLAIIFLVASFSIQFIGLAIYK